MPSAWARGRRAVPALPGGVPAGCPRAAGCAWVSSQPLLASGGSAALWGWGWQGLHGELGVPKSLWKAGQAAQGRFVFFFSGSWRGGMEEEKVRSCFFHCPTTLQWGSGTGELRSRLGAVPTALRGCVRSEVQSPWWLRSPDGTVVGHAAGQTPPCPGPARAGTKLPMKAKPFPKPPR